MDTKDHAALADRIERATVIALTEQGRSFLTSSHYMLTDDEQAAVVAALTAAEQVRASEPGLIVYLRLADAGHHANACWVVCAKGDPGARQFGIVD